MTAFIRFGKFRSGKTAQRGRFIVIDGTDGSGNSLLWEVDLRFMDGVYQGVDGNIHNGTFAEV